MPANATKQITEFSSFDLSFKLKAELDENAENYLTSITGEILRWDNVNLESEIVAGRVHLYYVDVEGAINEGYDLHNVLDHEDETYPY